MAGTTFIEKDEVFPEASRVTSHLKEGEQLVIIQLREMYPDDEADIKTGIRKLLPVLVTRG